MNDKTNSPMSLPDTKHLEELYSLFRNYIERENALINNRMTWFMTIQSFLIATFGFSYQKEFEVLSAIYLKDNAELLLIKENLSALISDYKYFLIILALIGVVTSFVALKSICAAFHAIDNIINAWEVKFLKDNWSHVFDNKPRIDYLPGIAGGGSKTAIEDGKKLGTALPIFFLGFWIFVIFIVLIKKVHIII